MENIDHLKELILPLLESNDIQLYELKWTGSGKDTVLQAAIMKPDGSMDLDTCAAVSEKISEILDESNAIRNAYTLEVCSPGAEREIHQISELEHMDHPYVYVRLLHPTDKKIEFTGTVKACADHSVTLEYRDKTATKTIQFSEENIEFMRLAVKF
ncbi:MAG: ribosome maturation factor RimP [Erysipelotrichia bacterium]|nr:ribosome maturation factor RimP [Erysipelotrichia bacterium]